MTTSEYDSNDESNENRICFWLRLSGWHLCEAALLLLDIDPDSHKWRDKEALLFDIKTFTPNTYSNYPWDLDAVTQKYDDMQRILSHEIIEYDTPSNWISYAVSKRINIPWLDFAIREGFYIENESKPTTLNAEKPLSNRTKNNYLRLIMALANGIEGFNPKKPFEAAKLIIEETEVKISQDTLASYISEAYQNESINRD